MSREAGVSLEIMIARATEAVDFLRQFNNANRLTLLCQIGFEAWSQAVFSCGPER